MTPRIAATDGPSTDSTTTRHTDQRQPAVRVGWRIGAREVTASRQ